MSSYNPHPNVLPQCAAEISALKTEVRNMRKTSEATHKLVTEQVIPTLAVLAARHEKKKSGLLNKIISSTITKALALLLTAIGLALLSLWGCEEDMHRTEGEDWYNEGTPEAPIRRFINQDLATNEPGTVDVAEWNNAVQEELCNVVELSGGTLATTAAADRAANWRQVYDRIFESEALDSDSIGELTVSKLSAGDINITVGDYDWMQDEQELRLRYLYGTTSERLVSITADLFDMKRRSPTAGTPLDSLFLSIPEGLRVTEHDDATGAVEIAQTSVRARGIKYTQRFGDNTELENAVYRKEAYDWTIASWAVSAAPVYTVTTVSNLALGIPYDANIVTGVWVQTTLTGAVTTVPASAAIVNTSGLAEIAALSVVAEGTPQSTSLVVIVEYNAELLDD